MRKSSFLSVALLALLLPCVSGRAQEFLVTVHGSVKFQNMVNGKSVVSSKSVTNATILNAFELSSKNNVVVFDASADVLRIVSRDADMGPAVLAFNGSTTDYQSDSPKGFLEFGTLADNGDADGTSFSDLSGVMTFKVSQKADSSYKGVSGTVNAASTDFPNYLYTISFSGTRVFTPKP